MKLSIISLQGVQFNEDVVSINLKTTSGEVTILNHHRPLITSLKSGTVKITKNDQTIVNLELKSGFLEVGRGNDVTILAN